MTRVTHLSANKAIRGECQSLINHFEDNPEDVTLMVGQKDGSKAVSTEALMTVFHPQDVENLDPKMVKTFNSLFHCFDLHDVGCWCFIHYEVCTCPALPSCSRGGCHVAKCWKCQVC